MKYLTTSLRMLLFMTLLTGIAYPLFVTAISQLFFSNKANGSLIEKNGILIGSELIGQNFELDRYFWPRPSAVGFNPLPSGGSNLGQASTDLKKTVEERRLKNQHANPGLRAVPQDLLFASGSGLDPHISVEAAEYQIVRVAKARSMETTAVRKLLSELTEGRQWGTLGEPRVNVLKLNLAMDALAK